MQLGASFSHPHLESLGIDPMKAIKAFKSLGLTWIRLGCYWDEIEKKQQKYSFTKLDPIVKYCNKHGIKIVMTVGMKAPRWPEYYIPNWMYEKLSLEKHGVISPSNKELLRYTLMFIRKCVEHYKKFDAIEGWQVENEPLDPSGPERMRIDTDFLIREIKLVKSIVPNKDIHINMWGGELVRKKVPTEISSCTDIIGIDLYPRQYAEHLGRYIGPVGPKFIFRHKINNIKKKNTLWMSELQAEPWEPNELVAKGDNPPSFLPQHFGDNLEYAASTKPEVVLLWGFEYWYWRKEKKNDNRYWEKAQKAINKYSI